MNNQTLDIEEVLEDVKSFLPRLAAACESAADLFYLPVSDQSWESFGEVVQGMDDLYRMMQSLSGSLDAKHAALRPAIEAFLPAMADKFADMNRYSDSEEYVSAADVIKHELAPLFRQLAILLGDNKETKSRRYRMNLDFLKEKFPHVYEQVKDAIEETDKYVTACSRDGLANLSLPTDEGNILWLYSLYDPRYEAARWVDSIADSVAGKTDILVYGFGLGYHLERLTDVYKQHQCYVYEPDLQIFLAAMYAVELEPLFARANMRYLAVGSDKNTVDQYFYRFLKYMKGDTATLSLPVYDRIGKSEEKRTFIENAKTAVLNYAFSQNLLEKVGLQWTRNIMNNMAANLDTPAILGLKDKLKGTTAVIVGAGPSLEADIEHLRKIKDHAFIIAAGSSIQSLSHYGIKPHLIVSIDGGDPNYWAFHHVNTDDIPFLYAPQLEYRIIENKAENLMHVFFANDIITQVLMGVTHDDPVFASNHSVTGTAIQAAIFMGCENIAFTGQDLSYPTASVYAPGAKHVGEGHDEYISSIANLKVENVQGGFNRTTDGMILTLKDIEDLLEQHPNVRFINASSLGAKIKHTTFHPMREILEEVKGQILGSNFFKESMKKHLYPHEALRIKSATGRVTEMMELLKKMDEKLVRIQKQLRKLPELSRGKPLKCLNAMVEIEEGWEPIVKSILFHTLFMTALKSEINEFDRNVSDIANEKDTIRKADLFCKVLGPLVQAMHDRIPTFQDIVGEAERRIAVRLHKTAPEVAL